MIPIENEKRIDWNAARMEYIGGGATYQSLADKNGVSKDAVARRAKAEGWQRDREKVREKTAKKVIQKTAEAAADNAVLAQDIKKRLLLRLSRIEQKYPLDATEVRTRQGNSTAVYRIRDLTAAYKDLTEDMPKSAGDKNAPIYELLSKLDGECDV